MKNLKFSLCLAALLAVLGGLSARASVLFDNTTWYSSGSSTTISLTSGTMGLVGANSALSYLTPSGTYQTLSIGQTITLTVVFSMPGSVSASATGLRFGLLNSGGSRVSGDNAGSSSATYANYAGYVATFGSSGTTSGSVSSALWERNVNNALINSSGAYTSNSSATTVTSGTPALSANTDYTLTLSLNLLSASDLKVTSSLSGGGLPSVIRSYDDLVNPTTSFDTVVLFATTSQANNLNFQSVSVVPEPSTASSLAAVLGAALVGVYVSHRRRRLQEPRL